MRWRGVGIVIELGIASPEFSGIVASDPWIAFRLVLPSLDGFGLGPDILIGGDFHRPRIPFESRK